MSKIHTDGPQALKNEDDGAKASRNPPVHPSRQVAAANEPHSRNQKAFNQLYAACRGTLCGEGRRPAGLAPLIAREPAGPRGVAPKLSDAYGSDVLPFDGSGIDTYALSILRSGNEQDGTDREQGSGSFGAPSPVQGVDESSEGELDYLALASLLPAGENDGIFEVTLPNGAKMGVVVADRPSVVSYLLRPDSDLLASRLRGHEMELEAGLKRRIRRNVKVAVL